MEKVIYINHPRSRLYGVLRVHPSIRLAATSLEWDLMLVEWTGFLWWWIVPHVSSCIIFPATRWHSPSSSTRIRNTKKRKITSLIFYIKLSFSSLFVRWLFVRPSVRPSVRRALIYTTFSFFPFFFSLFPRNKMEQQQSANNKSLSPASATSVSTSLTSITAHRRKRLVRSDNVMTTSNNSNNSSIGGSGSGGGGGHHNSLRSVGMHYGWESLFRESLLHMAWPISLSMSQEDGNPSSPRNLMIDFLPLKVR